VLLFIPKASGSQHAGKLLHSCNGKYSRSNSQAQQQAQQQVQQRQLGGVLRWDLKLCLNVGDDQGSRVLSASTAAYHEAPGKAPSFFDP